MFTAYANYWDFQGRAGRPEYWWFFLWVFIVGLVSGLVDAMVFHSVGLGGPCSLFTTFANLIPNLSLGVRRLHDSGRSGWWLLVGGVPLLGGGMLLYYALRPSEPGENRYGPHPGQRSYEDLHATFA